MATLPGFLPPREGLRKLFMRIKEIVSQHRRDFTAIYECEHCGATTKAQGYDDKNFHENVIPDMSCMACFKKASENYRPLTTKYKEDKVI